jgi:hypothetical protein
MLSYKYISFYFEKICLIPKLLPHRKEHHTNVSIMSQKNLIALTSHHVGSDTSPTARDTTLWGYSQDVQIQSGKTGHQSGFSLPYHWH